MVSKQTNDSIHVVCREVKGSRTVDKMLGLFNSVKKDDLVCGSMILLALFGTEPDLM